MGIEASNPGTTAANKYTEEALAFAIFQREADTAYLKEDLPTSEFASRLAAKKADHMRICSLVRLVWTLRYQGLRVDLDKNSPLREAKYSEAIALSEEIFRLSQFDINGYAEQRASIRAALALMYTDKNTIETICQEGLEELAKSTLAKQAKGNAEAPLYNSWGLLHRRTNTQLAKEKYLQGIEVAQDYTTAKGNLYNNLSDCFKNWAMDNSLSREDREKHFAQVMKNLELALEHYPENEEKHIKGVHTKMEDIKAKKAEFDKT